MKYVSKLVIVLIFLIFLSGCLDRKSETSHMTDAPTDNANPTATTSQHQSSETAQVTKISWKVKDHVGPYFDLYVVLNGTDFYAGCFFGENFETDENSWVSDAPESVLTTLSTLWTGIGDWFYFYQKTDTELAVMNHPVIYPEWYQSAYKQEIGVEEYKKIYEEYKEVLVIPIEKGSQIKIEAPIIIK